MQFYELMSYVLNEPVADLTNERELRDIEAWDSMTHMLLVSRVEQNYGVEFTGDEIASFRKIGDIKQALLSRNQLNGEEA